MNSKLYISKSNLKFNIEHIRGIIGKDKDIIAMVKANGYGAGTKNIVELLKELDITNFGVANIKEAIEVKQIYSDAKVIVTSVILDEEIPLAISHDITFSVSDMENIKEIDKQAKLQNKVACVHLKIDTGMTRLGFTIDDIKEKIDEILALENINVEGIYTHLSCADSDEAFTKAQINKFKSIVIELEKKISFKYIHFLNSDSTLRYSHYRNIDTHVRVGIAIYGYNFGLKPILKLTAPIIHINDIKEECKIGYGATAVAHPGQKIAVVKLGYADGMPRSLSNKLKVNINGNICKVVGNICMDLFMVDVTDLDVKVNDEVIIWDYSNDLTEIAKMSNRIVYEVISTLGNRIERIVE